MNAPQTLQGYLRCRRVDEAGSNLYFLFFTLLLLKMRAARKGNRWASGSGMSNGEPVRVGEMEEAVTSVVPGVSAGPGSWGQRGAWGHRHYGALRRAARRRAARRWVWSERWGAWYWNYTSGGGATGASGAGIAGSSPITGAVSGAPVTTVAVVGCARTDSSQGQGVAIAAATPGVAAARIASTLAANR